MELLLEALNVGTELLVHFGLPESALAIFRCTWCLLFETWFDFALGWIGDTREEAGRRILLSTCTSMKGLGSSLWYCASWWIRITQAFKVLSRRRSRPEINHSSLINDTNLIE